MGRNQRRRHGGARPRETRSTAPAPAAEVDALASAFVDWLGDEGLQADQRAVMDYVRAVMAVHRKIRPDSNSTSFRALTTEAAICLCVDSLHDGDDFFYIPLLNSMALFTNFLEQTGRWTGADEQLQELRVFYRRAHSGFNTVGPRHGFVWPTPDEAEQLEFLEAMPLARQAGRLVESLTSQLRDKPEAPWRQTVSEAMASFAAATPPAADTELLAFDLLHGLGISPFLDSAERLADIRKTLVDGSPDERLILLGTLVSVVLEGAFSAGSGSPEHEGTAVGYALGRLLAHAASTTGSVSGLVLRNPGALVPADLTEAAVEIYTVVGRRLAYLGELGIVVIGKDITIPPVLRRIILGAWEDVENESRVS